MKLLRSTGAGTKLFQAHSMPESSADQVATGGPNSFEGSNFTRAHLAPL